MSLLRNKGGERGGGNVNERFGNEGRFIYILYLLSLFVTDSLFYDVDVSEENYAS